MLQEKTDVRVVDQRKKMRSETTSHFSTEAIVTKKNSFGIRKDGFRSSYEYAFSVYLDELNIKYEFEEIGEEIISKEVIRLHYIPDFYLPEFHTYIEIVNVMDKRLRNKTSYYQQQHKERRLIIFDKISLRNMFDSKFNIYDIVGYPKEKNR